jgi:hypothetical protein
VVWISPRAILPLLVDAALVWALLDGRLPLPAVQH